MPLKYDAARREILPFVPQTARSILDVGCGSGRFGGELKTHVPSARLYAVEADSAHAQAARSYFDEVAVGFFPDAIPELGCASFDVIVFNDVLEHMMNPLDALREATKLLATDGRIVASIPNVRHISVTRRLVQKGQWTYTDYGILDRTHVRFFTRSSIAALFAEANLSAVLTGINRFGQYERMNRASRGFFEDFFSPQFAVVGERPMNS